VRPGGGIMIFGDSSIHRRLFGTSQALFIGSSVFDSETAIFMVSRFCLTKEVLMLFNIRAFSDFPT
jgi:hypothetical protein